MIPRTIGKETTYIGYGGGYTSASAKYIIA